MSQGGNKNYLLFLMIENFDALYSLKEIVNQEIGSL